MRQIEAIAGRIRELRTFNDYSQRETAQKIGVSEAEYAEYESGKKDIPIGIIYKLASVLDVEPAIIITGNYPEESVCSVSYDGTGTVIQRHPGYRYLSLAEGFKNKQMKPMIVTIEPDDDTELFVHEGQEFNYILEGKVRIVVGEKEYFLREGDAAYFDPSKPHAQYAMSKRAKFLTVINE
ncbi:MAG: XRE family transcriptional regulator [Clostridiales bacterium]|jgi:transcriptional regulator with XRE-family HTH domain|nr:XRE family transcriptional regulator [Clostridiales bacterium]